MIKMTRIMKKKAEGLNFTMMVMVVAVLMGLLIIWGFKTDFFSGMNIVGSTVDPTAISACNDRETQRLLDRNTYNQELDDKDKDGIIDVCDICVLEATETQFDDVMSNELRKKLDGSGTRSYDYDKYSANSVDDDFDGIIDGCDANIDSEKKPTSGSGLNKNILKSQCYALAKQSGDLLSADIRGESTQGYPQCHLVPTDI